MGGDLEIPANSGQHGPAQPYEVVARDQEQNSGRTSYEAERGKAFRGKAFQVCREPDGVAHTDEVARPKGAIVSSVASQQARFSA